MAVWLVVVALASVAASGALAWTSQRSANREAHRAVQEALETALRMVETRPTQPDPIILPAPDLRPYLQDLARMGQGMARELAQGISLVVQGPPTQPPGTEAPGETPAEDEEPVEFPAWETDDTWGVLDDRPPDGEWTAALADQLDAGRAQWEADFATRPFGAGGTRLPDNEGL